MIQYFNKHNANINKINRLYKTLLIIVCNSENKTMLSSLLEHETNINFENINLETPPFKSCRSGNENIDKYLCEQDINKHEK